MDSAQSATRLAMFSKVRIEARTLEADCDQLLSRYSSLGPHAENAGTVANSIQDNLNERADKVESLFELASEPEASSAWRHQAQRHHEVLEDHKKTFSRLSNQYKLEQNRENLLSSVRSDIESHRARTPQDESTYYADERGRIEQSNSLADSLLQQAYETRAEFSRQQQVLKNVQRRIWHAASKMPGINTLISRINTRQKRNSLIMAAVITICILFLIFFH